MTADSKFIRQCADDLKAFVADGPEVKGKHPQFFPLLGDGAAPYEPVRGQSAAVEIDPAQPDMREKKTWENVTN